jgi:adenosylcobinamide-GDP ribazoletransferase
VSGLRLALGFLTALPIRPRGRLAPGDLGRAAAWFPLVGLAIGVVLWGVRTLLEGHLPALVVGAVVVGMWAAASGALHLDGLADCMDGMMASVPPDRRLVIMADVRVGAFAAAGLCLFLITKIAAAAGLSSSGPLLLAPTLGRWWLLPLARMRSAHPGGLGDQLHAALGWRWLPALLTALLVTAPFGWAGARAWVASGAAALLWGGLARARIGGQTGDVLGAACEWAELAALLSFLWR